MVSVGDTDILARDTDNYSIYFILLTGSTCAAGILKTASVHLPSISVHYPFPPIPPGDTGIVGVCRGFQDDRVNVRNRRNQFFLVISG